MIGNRGQCENCGSENTNTYLDQQYIAEGLHSYEYLACHDCGAERKIGEYLD